jgi:hypothetical protein
MIGSWLPTGILNMTLRDTSGDLLRTALAIGNRPGATIAKDTGGTSGFQVRANHFGQIELI